MLTKSNGSTTHVKFVSYTGKYPNLCMGELTLEVNGIEYKFMPYGYDNKTSYPSFWETGGGVTTEYDCYQGEWIIVYEKLPEELKKYAAEIDWVFNENVEYGCCGGCI